MEGWSCFCRRRQENPRGGGGEPETFFLPEPIPAWPQGGGFGQGRICIGEVEVAQISRFRSIWSSLQLEGKGKGATFYRPVGVPDGFFTLGHHCQANGQPVHGYVLVARELGSAQTRPLLPPLQRPQDYVLVWSSNGSRDGGSAGDHGYFWVPLPPEGYKAVGCLVTRAPDKPSLDDVRCVRADLTDECEAHSLVLGVRSMSPDSEDLSVWRMRPSHRGMRGRGVLVGTFGCTTCGRCTEEQSLACLKNVDLDLYAMPNLQQINSVVQHYGPTVFFHPKETYLPSSVSWFFENGGALHKRGEAAGEDIDSEGSNLASGGQNDGEYWIDLLPADERNSSRVKHGDLESAELYAHIKPALGGTFTDIAMWVFCPFNGPATLKIGMADIALKRTGQHVGDWEHFTLRVSNFTGELWSIYFSQHSGGRWVDAPELEFIEGNKAVVYSSKSGHACFPHPGAHLQGSQALGGIGIRNDAARSDLFVDSSVKYQIVSAEYLGDVVAEPPWLQFMRQWGPTVIYSSRKKLEKMLSYLPLNIKYPVENVLSKLPTELHKEEGPTGPKEKNNWVGDERG